MFERASPVHASARESTPSAEPSRRDVSTPPHPLLTLQRSIGNRAVGHILKSRPLQTKLRIHPPGDVYEREADRVSDSIVEGSSGPVSSLTSTLSIQRDDTSAPPSPPSDTAAKLKQAATKTSDALRQTNAGKQLETEAAKLGKDFLSTLEGKVIASTVVAGVLAAIVATDSELPAQPPEIPLDWIAPGLKGKLTYEGKVREPSKVFVTFTFTPGEGEGKKHEPSQIEQFRASTARMAAEYEKFRRGFSYTAGSEQDQDAKAEQQALQHWAAAQLGIEKPLPSPSPKTATFARDAWKDVWDNYFRLRRSNQFLPASGQPVEISAPSAPPVQRKETAPGSAAVGPNVEEVLRSPAPPLDSDTRQRMEGSFGRDFSQVRVHTGPTAAGSAESINARAYTVGRDIVFGSSQYAPGTREGTRLLAHELTHVVQQSAATEAPASPSPASASPRFAQPPATPFEKEADQSADRAASGDRVGAVSHVPPGSIQRQTPKAQKDDLPPAAAVYSSLHGLHFRPVDKNAAFHKGSGELQIVAMAVRALLDADYKPELAPKVLDALKRGEGGFKTTPEKGGGPQDGSEPIGISTWEIPVSLRLLDILKSMGHPPKLSKEKIEMLALGRAGSEAFPLVMKLGLPAWYTESIFLNAIAQRASLLREFSKATQPQPAGTPPPNTSAIVQKMFEALKPAATVLEDIRRDPSLVSHPAYQALWPPPKDNSAGTPAPPAPAVMAATDQPPAGLAGIQFLTYVETQPDLRDTILGNDLEAARKDRKEILDRFGRALGTNLFAPKADSAGDQQLTDEPPESNAEAYPSTLTVYPPVEPPLFDISTKAEYAFEMHIMFPDIFAAFQSHKYLFKIYPVPKEKVVGASKKPLDMLDPKEGLTYSNFDRFKGRLAQDTDYNAEDLQRSVHDFDLQLGRPGVGLDAIGVNSLMRYIGTTLRTLIELIADPPSLKRLRFPNEGLFIVAAFAKAMFNHRAEIVRLPAAAYMPVFARSPKAIAESRVQQALDAQDSARDRIVELVGLLADPKVEHRDDLVKELRELQAQFGGVQDLLKFQKKTLEDRKKDTDNPPSPQDLKQIDARIEKIDQILEVRRKSGLDAVTERLTAVMVSDSGQVVNLLLEAVDQTKPNATDKTYLVVDSTTPSGHQASRSGKTRPEALRAAVKAVMEKGSYGRGQISVTIDNSVLDFRIAADSAAQMNEAMANISLLLSIAAVAAAPFTGGASLALLIPAGVIGAIPSAYRLVERGAEHTLRFDMESAMDVVNIVGAVVGLGAESQLAQRSLWMGRALLISGVGAAGTGMVLMGAQLMDQIAALEDLPEGMRAAQLTQIMGNAMLQAGIMLGGALMAKSKVGESMRSAEQNESSMARWRDEALDKPTREEFDKNPEAKAAYADMPEVVRNLLTLCGSFCIDMRPPPTKGQVKKIEAIANKLGAADQRWLKGYLHEKRGSLMNDALAKLEKVPADKLPDVLHGLVTDPSIVLLMAFSEEFRTPEVKAAAEALMKKGTLPVERIGAIMDKVRRQKGSNPSRMLRYLDKLGDIKPSNYEKVLRDLEIGGSLHKGAEWVLRFLVDSSGDLLSKVAKFEEEAEPGGRRWDFVIEGKRYQLKSWSRFYEETFRRQMLEDYRLTGEFQGGIVQWVFDDITSFGGKSDIINMMRDVLYRAVDDHVEGYDLATADRISRNLPAIVRVGLQ
jgi:Domain of unknown function (DUF4157)